MTKREGSREAVDSKEHKRGVRRRRPTVMRKRYEGGKKKGPGSQGRRKKGMGRR